jgi:hypothetical protein
LTLSFPFLKKLLSQNGRDYTGKKPRPAALAEILYAVQTIKTTEHQEAGHCPEQRFIAAADVRAD